MIDLYKIRSEPTDALPSRRSLNFILWTLVFLIDGRGEKGTLMPLHHSTKSQTGECDRAGELLSSAVRRSDRWFNSSLVGPPVQKNSKIVVVTLVEKKMFN